MQLIWNDEYEFAWPDERCIECGGQQLKEQVVRHEHGCSRLGKIPTDSDLYAIVGPEVWAVAKDFAESLGQPGALWFGLTVAQLDAARQQRLLKG
jgi:hypothetical protein